jgi:hypothetical protein
MASSIVLVAVLVACDAAGGGADTERRPLQRPALVRPPVATLGALRVHPEPGDSSPLRAEAFVRGRESQLRFCYAEYGLAVDSTLTGFVELSAVVGPDGSANSVTARAVSEGWRGSAAEAVATCLRAKLAAWRWPPPRTRTRYTITAGFARDVVPGPAPYRG